MSKFVHKNNIGKSSQLNSQIKNDTSSRRKKMDEILPKYHNQ